MYSVRKQFTFSASHSLKGLTSDHPCMRDHGHNYIVEIVLSSKELDEHGFVKDYREMDVFKKLVDDTIDHRNLNDVFFPMQTTAENISRRFYQVLLQMGFPVSMVRVSETPKTWAEYSE